MVVISRGIVRAGLLLLCGGLLMIGCSKKSSTDVSPQTDAASGQDKTNLYTDVLASALFQLQPDNLGIDSGAESAISVLNSWREQTGLITVDGMGIAESDVKSLPADLITETQREALLSPEFTNADAFYLRNAVFLAAVAKWVTQSSPDELSRVMALFDYSMRNVSLISESIPKVPFPLFEVFRLGLGTPSDRGWAFAALLKQQRIDSVIFQSKSDPKQQLFGVILDGEIYLFDTRLGLPIPRGDDPPGVRITRPATLSELQAHPEWWQGLTVRADQPYPWKAEELAAADVLIYTEAESWCGRMKRLETVLPAASACVLYDSLFDAGSSPGLIRRIAQGNPAWSADRLRFWSYPLTVRQEAAKMRDQILSILTKFQVPLEFVFDKESGDRLIDAKPTFQHAKCRVEQLLGKFDDATAHFLTVRHLMLESLPAALQSDPKTMQQIQQIYTLAVLDATYWTAMCKFEQGDWKGAAKGFGDYLKRFPQSLWASAARLHLMQSLVEQGEFAAAQSIGNMTLAEDPHREETELLLQRWAKHLEQTSNKPPSETPSEPAAPATATP